MLMFLENFLTLAAVAWVLCAIAYGIFVLFRRNRAPLQARLISFAALIGIAGAGAAVGYVVVSFLGEL